MFIHTHYIHQNITKNLFLHQSLASSIPLSFFIYFISVFAGKKSYICARKHPVIE